MIAQIKRVCVINQSGRQIVTFNSDTDSYCFLVTALTKSDQGTQIVFTPTEEPLLEGCLAGLSLTYPQSPSERQVLQPVTRFILKGEPVNWLEPPLTRIGVNSDGIVEEQLPDGGTKVTYPLIGVWRLSDGRDS